MTDRETRLKELEAAFARVPVEPVESAADLAESERIRAARHFGFTPEDHPVTETTSHGDSIRRLHAMATSPPPVDRLAELEEELAEMDARARVAYRKYEELDQQRDALASEVRAVRRQVSEAEARQARENRKEDAR